MSTTIEVKSRQIFGTLPPSMHAEYSRLVAAAVRDLATMLESESRRERMIASDLMRAVLWHGGDSFSECAHDLFEIMQHFSYDATSALVLVHWLSTADDISAVMK